MIGSLLGFFGAQVEHGTNILKDGSRALPARLHHNIQELNASLRLQRVHGESSALFVEVNIVQAIWKENSSISR
ncbi:unnamed protein product [Sphagnum tenellum]